MKQKNRAVLLCTVGTSLFSNLERLEENSRIHQAYQAKEWGRLARTLLEFDPADRICGAEINTVHALTRKKLPNLKKIVFFVSDTEEGENTGKLLQAYFESWENHEFQKIEYRTVDMLQDKEPKKFKSQGLRNLVRELGAAIQQAGGPEFCAIDATGGYKAQIAIAVIMGQVLDIPVYYKHERFPEIIDFPPLPVSFDYSILGFNADILIKFEQHNTVLSQDEMPAIDDKLRIFFNEEEIDGVCHYELNPVGMIYLTAYRLRTRQPRPPGNPAESRKPPTFGNDHHYPKGFKEFLNKVFKENDWIQTAHTLPYSGQQGIQGRGFRVVPAGDKCYVEGYFKNRDFGCIFQTIRKIVLSGLLCI